MSLNRLLVCVWGPGYWPPANTPGGPAYFALRNTAGQLPRPLRECGRLWRPGEENKTIRPHLYDCLYKHHYGKDEHNDSADDVEKFIRFCLYFVFEFCCDC